MLRVKGQFFDQPDRVRMSRGQLLMNSLIWAFLLSDGPSRARVMARHLSAAFGSSISLLSVIAADNEGWMLTEPLNP